MKWARDHATSLGIAALIGVAQFALVWLALRSRMDGGTLAPFWPPAGFVLAILTRLAWRHWPVTVVALLAANFLANWMEPQRGAVLSLLLTLDDVLCPLGGALVLRRWLDPDRPLTRRDEVFSLVLVAIAVTLVSTLISLPIGHYAGWTTDPLGMLRRWGTAIFLGVLVVSPLILTRPAHPPRWRLSRRQIELILVQLALAVTVYLLFHRKITTAAAGRPLMYIPFPFLIWAALRGGPFGAAWASFILGVIGTMETVRGYGPVAAPGSDPLESLAWLQAFFAVAAITAMLLAAIVDEYQQSLRDRDAQTHILGMIASGRPLEETARELVLEIEHRAPGMIGSILMLDDDGKTLRTLAGPNLPEQYNRLVDGIQIGPVVGSCGTAAYRRQRVIVTDIDNDPLWEPYLPTLGVFGLKACWSQPIIAPDGSVLGTFAMYYREWRSPKPGDLRLIDAAAGLAGIAIGRHRVERALRRREREYASLLSNLSGVVYRLQIVPDAPDVKPTYISNGVLALCGYRADEIIEGRYVYFRDLIHPEDRQRVYDCHQEHIVSREPIVLEYRIVTRRGEVKWLLDQAQIIFDDDEQPLYIEGIVNDITARKAAEDAADSARKAAEDANKAKDQFLAMLSHELRTPLTPVLLYVSAIERDRQVSPELREEIGVIRQQIEHETRLIDDLLDVTRIQRGKFPIQRRDIDLAEIIRRVAEINFDLLKEKGLALELNLSAGDHRLHADPARMQQLLINLLSNAIKFTPPGGHIRIHTDNPMSERLRLVVSDTGMGIPPAELPKLFNPFEQGLRARSPEFGGLGLGLTIVKAIVELHGGTITAASEGINRGTSMTVELPRLPSAPIVSPWDVSG